MLVSSSANHFTTWSLSKFVAHNNMSVDSISSVAFNTDTNTIAVAFLTTAKVRILNLRQCIAATSCVPKMTQPDSG